MENTESEQRRSVPAKSQKSYKPTPYEDSSWEVVGQYLNQNTFEPTGFSVIAEQAVVLDPMFADYGGIPEGQPSVRMHGVESGRINPLKKRAPDEDEGHVVDENSVVITKAELEEMLAAAESQGFAAGEEHAVVAAEERNNQLREHFNGILQDLGQQISEKLREAEKTAATLAIQISEKLVSQAVEINPEYIMTIVRKALSLSGGATIKSVRVSREDMDFINLLNLSKQFEDYDGTWIFEADDSIRAGCVIETSAGSIDFDIDKAWHRIKDQVMKAL